ncbi:NAD-dependent epimerase/dehydratase family protein [Streptomyces sp. NPDC006172]|uniref:NAD-dependent epimerase/dehydratase family protein n=1 Tax=Streptomyces sp. NPDC006172 TaxID=3154470 RepID=UPI00340C988E
MRRPVRVVVTGASGFIGSRLCALLRSAGQDVTEVDLPYCDIGDTSRLTNVLKQAEPDHLYHLAAQAHVGRSWREPTRTWYSNAWGTVSLLKAVRSACPATKALVVSSASVFDGARLEGAIGEHRTPAALSPYGASKLAVEAAARHHVAAYGLRIVVVRPFNIIGPGQSQEYLVPSLARRVVAAVQHGAVRIPVGGLEPRRDFLDVRDAVRGLRRLMADGQPGEVYHLCTGVGVTIRTLVETMISVAGVPLGYYRDPSLVRRADAPFVVGDPGATLARTGWQATVPLATSLRDVLDEARGPGLRRPARQPTQASADRL